MGFTVVWGDVKIRCQTAVEVLSVVGELRGSDTEVGQRQSGRRRAGVDRDEPEESSPGPVPGHEDPATPR